ncbi:MAG: hypothetical protein R3305_10870, partial [Gammaproteobacteria bacterium]|nr:hypothetical protein [Gammaproteobacteria bacterium]
MEQLIGTSYVEEAQKSRIRAEVYSLVLPLCLCMAVIVVGWGVVIGSLMYVVAAYSTTTFLLTALGVAAVHAAVAIGC